VGGSRVVTAAIIGTEDEHEVEVEVKHQHQKVPAL